TLRRPGAARSRALRSPRGLLGHSLLLRACSETVSLRASSSSLALPSQAARAASMRTASLTAVYSTERSTAAWRFWLYAERKVPGAVGRAGSAATAHLAKSAIRGGFASSVAGRFRNAVLAAVHNAPRASGSTA